MAEARVAMARHEFEEADDGEDAPRRRREEDRSRRRPRSRPRDAPPAAAEPHLAREQLPIPDAKHVGLTTYDAKDPNTKYPPITPLRPPEGAPNVLIVLIDDVGFGASSALRRAVPARRLPNGWRQTG